MKRAWISVVLLTVLIVCAALQSYWIHDSLTELADLFDRGEWFVDAGEWESAEENIWEALTIWDQYRPALSLLMREHELDEGSLIVSRAAEAVRIRDREQFKLENAALQYWLLHKAEGERLSIANLL